jgi:hypothetical protein
MPLPRPIGCGRWSNRSSARGANLRWQRANCEPCALIDLEEQDVDDLLRRIALVAHHGIIQILRPVDVHSTGNVSRTVKQHIFIALDDAPQRIVQMLGDHSVPTRAAGWA